jgi:outer membrane receptor protein involved in Fe transport
MVYRKTSPKSYKHFKSLAATFIGAALAASLSPSVLAQDDEGGAADDTIVVTGTRILKRDYVSNSPIVTVDAEQFESRMGLNIESYLNQMPEFNPASSPVTTQFDVQITPINSVGVATISLRGFGANRNLILVDGKRPVPINALMVTDINGIPSAMIARVETITGGASAVYGADAVGGVTNFILRDDFEGLEMDAQYGISEAGDGAEYRVSSIVGADVSDGRGNITVAMEYYQRERALNKERDFFTDAWKSPDVGGNFIGFLQGINGYSCAFNCPSAAVANGLFPNAPAGTTISNPWSYFDLGAILGLPPGIISPKIGFFSTFNFNANGTVWFQGSRAGMTKLDGSIVDGTKYTMQNTYDISVPANAAGAPVPLSQLKYNFTEGYTSGPQERYSIMLNGRYDITDSLTFRSRATWAESKTRTLLAGNNAIFGWEADIPYNQATDSPITAAAITANSTAADVANVLANPGLFANPNFIPTNSGAFTYCQAGLPTCTPAAGATSIAARQVGVAAGSPLIGTPVYYHPVPLELAILLNSRATATGAWIPQWNTDDSWDFRNTYNTNTTWQVEGGLEYDIPFKDWSGELYFSHGESSTYNINTGNMSLTRYRALAGLPDYGRNARISGNSVFLIPGTNAASSTVGTAASANFGAGDITCQSGFYDTYFGGEKRPSEDCIQAIDATLQSRTQNQQNILELNLQGGVMELPAGELRGAVGFQWRENKGQFYPDILQSEQSWMDQVVGVYPTGYLDAKTSVKDYYVEALVPLLSDLPFLQKLELETGARYSDYNVADSTWTYKFLGNAEVTDWLRLRGGYNRATRAPNLGELFLNVQELFAVGSQLYGDACGWQSSAPWGASGAMARPGGVPNAGQPSALAGGQTAAGANSTYLICQAMMGNATAINAFYTGALNSGAAGAGFSWVLQHGTPDLDSEKADTFTAGFVFRSPLETPWLSGLSASVDWWKVKITNAIQQYSIDYASFLCFGTVTVTSAAEAAAQAATPACQNVPRSTATGGALTATLAYANLATIATSGVDFGVNWIANLGDLGFDVPGSVGVSVQATWLDYYKTKQSPEDFDLEIDWAGSLGPTLSGTNPGAYDYRVFTNFSYFQDQWGVNLTWRHLPSVWGAPRASQQAIIDHNAAVAAGGPGFLLSYTPGGGGPAAGPFVKTDSYNVLDLSFNWDISEMWTLRGGVTNLLDTSPEITGAAGGYPAGTALGSVCAGAPGCVNPIAYSLPNPGSGITNGGFYDTIGRRFFLGLKARF